MIRWCFTEGNLETYCGKSRFVKNWKRKLRNLDFSGVQCHVDWATFSTGGLSRLIHQRKAAWNSTIVPLVYQTGVMFLLFKKGKQGCGPTLAESANLSSLGCSLLGCFWESLSIGRTSDPRGTIWFSSWLLKIWPTPFLLKDIACILWTIKQ